MSNTTFSLPCITVKYLRSNGTYKASHKRDSNKTLRKATAGNSEFTDFENAKEAAINLTKVWEIGAKDWSVVSAGHDSDNWFFIMQESNCI